MTVLEIYAFFGVPIIAILMGLGALWLVKSGSSREERLARKRAEHGA